jgi:hypothetical protein
MEHANQFFPAICAGLGLFLAGGANLLLVRSRAVFRLLATAGSVGVALAAAAALEHPRLVANTARLIAVGLVPFVLLASRRLTAGAAVAVAALRRPAARYALLAAVGVGTAVGSVLLYERADADMVEADMAELELIHSRPPCTPVQHEKAATDRGTRIVLREPIGPSDARRLSVAEERLLGNAYLREQVIRQGAADERTNCHGWVFTGGRYILSAEDVEVILRENGYAVTRDPRPGDLVIYRNYETITHTALVQYVAEGQPALVRGKWGNLGLFLHHVDKSPYGTDFTYYRSPRSGHLLATGPATADAVPTGVAE